MVNRPAKRGVTVIDPMFEIPEGVDELVYNEGNINSSEAEFEQMESDGFDGGSYDDGSGSDEYSEPDDEMDSPDVMGIVPPQTMRTSASGTQVVDIVIEVEDVVGALNYEVRVTKV